MHNGKVIQLVRQILGLSQAGMAEAMGVTTLSLSEVELGKKAGNHVFWDALHATYGIDQADVGSLARKWRYFGNEEFAFLTVKRHTKIGYEKVKKKTSKKKKA